VETNTTLPAGSCTTPRILAPIQKLTAQSWPGVPVLPFLLQGAGDGLYLNAAGIPTYGIEPAVTCTRSRSDTPTRGVL
jgi:hypothetical protein